MMLYGSVEEGLAWLEGQTANPWAAAPEPGGEAGPDDDTF